MLFLLNSCSACSSVRSRLSCLIVIVTLPLSVVLVVVLLLRPARAQAGAHQLQRPQPGRPLARRTVMTALAFTLVVGLMTVMLAFVNGMYRLTENSGVPATSSCWPTAPRTSCSATSASATSRRSSCATRCQGRGRQAIGELGSLRRRQPADPDAQVSGVRQDGSRGHQASDAEHAVRDGKRGVRRSGGRDGHGRAALHPGARRGRSGAHGPGPQPALAEGGVWFYSAGVQPLPGSTRVNRRSRR